MANWNDYQQPNLGMLFYKHIFFESNVLENIKKGSKNGILKIEPNYKYIDENEREKSKPLFDDFYNELYHQKTSLTIPHPLGEQVEETNIINLYTTYPGLTMGTGYDRETKTDGDFKIGFFFDHTTGQPILPGSSVKGVLKSLFELDENNTTSKKSIAALAFIADESKNEQLKNIFRKLSESSDEQNKQIEQLAKIKNDIFGTSENLGNDVFFDAVIDFGKLGNKHFLSNDFITPHIKDDLSYEASMLKNPVPLMFLKVLPDVPVQFRFKLCDTIVEDVNLTRELKLALCETILRTIGAGAKTNVGYGQFSDKQIEGEPAIHHSSSLDKEIPKKASNKNRKFEDDINNSKIYTKNNTNGYEAELIEIIEENENYYKFEIDNNTGFGKDVFYKKETYFKKGKTDDEFKTNSPKVGDIFILTVKNESPFQYGLKPKK